MSLIIVAYILSISRSAISRVESRSSARLLQRRRSRQLLHAHGKRATHRAATLSLRACEHLWAAIAVPVIKMMKGEWWKPARCRTLVCRNDCAVVFTNPLMPDEVRMAHLLETATSNFLFGWLVVLILRGTDRARLKLATNPPWAD